MGQREQLVASPRALALLRCRRPYPLADCEFGRPGSRGSAECESARPSLPHWRMVRSPGGCLSILRQDPTSRIFLRHYAAHYVPCADSSLANLLVNIVFARNTTADG